MKKALFISSKPIYPIICGGQIRTEQQLEFLSHKYDVDVIFISDIKNPEIEPYLKFSKSVKFFYRSKIKCLLGTTRFIFNNLPMQVNYFFERKMDKYIRSVISNYDLVFCNNIRTAEFVRGIKGVNRVIDFVDAISMNYDKARKHSKGLKKIIYEIDYRRCKLYETSIVKEFEGCSIISEVDKKYIESCQK